jgi:hypothetical protein
MTAAAPLIRAPAAEMISTASTYAPPRFGNALFPCYLPLCGTNAHDGTCIDLPICAVVCKDTLTEP